MKEKCRKGIPRRSAYLLVAMLILMSLLTACGTEGKINRYYDLDVVEHTSDFYINDFAGVFSEDQKDELMANAVALDEQYSGIQIVITTVESLDKTVLDYEYVVEDAEGNRIEDSKEPSSNPKFTIEQVAYSMYSQYGIGQDDMGILILFSTGDREVRIETGRQMQFYITDSISGRILDDYGMDYFVEDKFAEGLVSVQAAVINEIKAHVSADWYTASKENQTDSESIGNTVADTVTEENSGGNVATTEKSEEKDSRNGIIWGVFGSIAVAFATIVAFIRQILRSKAERESLKKANQVEKETLEKAKQEEIQSLKLRYQKALDERDRNHEATLSSLKSYYEQLNQEKDNVIEKMIEEAKDAQHRIGTLKKQLEAVTDKYNRAQQLHPEYNFEDEVIRMIESEYKAVAHKLDGNFAEVLATSATKDNGDVFKSALSLFDSVRPEVKKYVTSDRSAIQKLYYEAVRLKQEFEKAEQEKRDKAAAQAAYDKIRSIYKDIPQGNHETYNSLKSALAIFLGLSAAEKAFFPDNDMIENMKKLYWSAEVDYNDYEAAREAESNVRSIIGRMHSAHEDDSYKLTRAMKYYRNLTSAQQKYFPDELHHKLKKLIEEAESDHRRQERRRADEAAAARRRAQQISSSSSFSSSGRSSFGGHGGRPSGGGASRRF